jgi:large subunit ribosomal protein L31
MKADIHPKYETVVFRDLASGVAFLTRSTVSSSKTIEWEDGNSYPVFDVEISSASHPFYTGKQRIMDTAGRVERFNARYKGRFRHITVKPFSHVASARSKDFGI